MVKRLSDVVSDVSALIEPISLLLSHLEVQVQTLKQIDFFGLEQVDEMRRQVEPLVSRAVEDIGAAVVGAGFVWLGEAGDKGMLWWRSEPSGLVPKSHVNNPHSDAFYDYQSSEWFQLALSHDDMVIAGPFFDAWGTDDHAMTPALRVTDHNNVTIGVVSADLDVHKFTSQLTDILKPAKDLAVVNQDGHVVAANVAKLTPGLRMEAFLSKHGMQCIDRARLIVSGWELVRIA